MAGASVDVVDDDVDVEGVVTDEPWKNGSGGENLLVVLKLTEGDVTELPTTMLLGNPYDWYRVVVPYFDGWIAFELVNLNVFKVFGVGVTGKTVVVELLAVVEDVE